MDFNYNDKTIFLVENITDIDFENSDVETYLGICADLVNNFCYYGFTLGCFKKMLKIILDKQFFNFRKLNKMKTYDKWLHDLVVQTIKIELDKFKNLDNEFYEFYTSKLNNDYMNYYIPYRRYCYNTKLINDWGINKAYLILQQILEFKQVINFN